MDVVRRFVYSLWLIWLLCNNSPTGIVRGEQMSNTHFILELHHLMLAIKTMVYSPQCMLNGEVKYTLHLMVGLSESGIHTDE